MTLSEPKLASLTARAAACAPHAAYKFAAIALLIFGALISAVISHYVEVELSQCDKKKLPATIRRPWFWHRRRLRAVIRQLSTDPRFLDRVHEALSRAGYSYEVEIARLGGIGAIDGLMGDDAHQAILGLLPTLTDDDFWAAGIAA